MISEEQEMPNAKEINLVKAPRFPAPIGNGNKGGEEICPDRSPTPRGGK
jgi:hypothetical protein